MARFGVMILTRLLVFSIFSLVSSTAIKHRTASSSSSSTSPPANKLPARPLTPKYFDEPRGSLARSHYDLRFFSSEVDYQHHGSVLTGLIRSYLSVMDTHGVETWLAHGTLLGWWWNGRVMPWDYDLDVQVSNATLSWMAARLNQTRHLVGGGEYLLDINPHFDEVDRGDGMNIIDARWIDVSNGMFIDITALREREQGLPGVWSCKNKHRYRTRDLWPMRVSQFEGVAARVPYNVEKMLMDEYGAQCLVVEEHEG
ncbi:transfer of mannosylphosphate [Ophiocordyceps camponoti-floridani]|uniref:Transfer of mannosylphosphate n=1 Tax=Ophiocordyceps camponoti-floridani TaxID=2030778 RepID=A0A8H4Q936_9HYPO|nr:transfer of mannosylphosphate [Ophiocordyceps camponoti-floridani]